MENINMDADTKRQFEQCLEQYPGLDFDWKDPERYEGYPAESLAVFCRMKDRSNDMYLKRLSAAQAVIDQLARIVGIDPKSTGLWLYALDYDGNSAISRKLEEYISRAGDKAKLKRRVDELEGENRVLRSLLKK